MKTLKEIRLEYIRSILDENGWDFKKASRILEISESRLLREAKSAALLPAARAGKRMGKK
jgi:transcriptional regulator with PAS, ATPase and Fis domain